jgi:hypothetical protein
MGGVAAGGSGGGGGRGGTVVAEGEGVEGEEAQEGEERAAGVCASRRDGLGGVRRGAGAAAWSVPWP